MVVDLGDLEMALQGDLVTFMVDKPRRVWNTLLELQADYAREPVLFGLEQNDERSPSAPTLDVVL